MKDIYKKIILIICAILVLIGAYYLIVRPANAETAALLNEIATLNNRYNTLLELKANQAQYEADIEANHAMFDAKLAEFPSDWNQEYQIEFVENIRRNDGIDYNVTTQGMAEPIAYYVLGGGTISEGAIEGGEVMESDNYTCYTQTMNFSYEGSYEGVKNFVDYAAAYKYRMTIDNVSITSADEEGNPDWYTGTMLVTLYSISGNDRSENFEIDLDDVQTGVDDIFTGGSASGTVSKYAVDNGASIVSDYDLYITVNPASSDTSGKIVGIKGNSNTVTSSKNESESVKVSVSLIDGDYVAEYTIGGTTQTQIFEPGEDLTMLIQSSDLKDSDDANAISLSIENTTDKTLYVRVEDDENASRVKITNKAGSVIVYR